MTEQTQKPEAESLSLAEPRDESAATATVSPSISPWERIKSHKVVQWTLAYLALAYTLLHGAEMLAGSLGWPHVWLRVFTLLLIIGVPVVLTIAWYHGARGQQRVSGTEVMIIALLLAVGGAVVWRDRSTAHDADERGASSPAAGASNATARPTGPPPAASIAVLPFADLSADKDQQYFSDGIAEEILNVLVHIEGLKVASRTSAFQFRSAATGIPAIARELGVRHVLEGSVRKSGNRVRITAQLIDAAADEHLWAETFDRTLTAEDLFAIQDEIAAATVAALRTKLGAAIAESAPAAPVRTTKVEAYELFLEARGLFQARRDLGTADELLSRAIEIDPKFADALAIRAAIYQFGGEYGVTFDDERAARATGRALAEKALAIDGTNSLAIAVVALSHIFDHAEGISKEPFEKIFANFKRALELNPADSNALTWLGVAYSLVGSLENAVVTYTRCVEADPTLAACRSNLAAAHLSLGRVDAANKVIDAAADAGVLPANPLTLLTLADLKRRDAFLFQAFNGPLLRGWRKFGALYDALSRPGQDHRALAAELEAFLDEAGAPARAYGLLNAIGDYERPLVGVYHWLPAMRAYRRSPEFKTHMTASGLPDYWRKHGFPPQCRPVGSDDFKCE
jgi:TolB-like protein/Tfp pilus assembly protein PilF